MLHTLLRNSSRRRNSLTCPIPMPRTYTTALHQGLGSELLNIEVQACSDCLHTVTIVWFYFLLLCLPFSFSFNSLWVAWLYLVMDHMSSHMISHLTMSYFYFVHESLWLFTCVSSLPSLWLTLPNLWLHWELPCHWLILPHHTLQYDVTVYVYLPILSTPVVVYKSGILGTQSPRLDFTSNTVLVNRSPTRRNSIPHTFHLRHSSQRLCVLGGVTHHQKL